MANQAIETVSSGMDRAKIGLAVLIFLAGIVGYYMLGRQPGYVQLAAILAGTVVAVLVFWSSGPGRRLAAFVSDSWNETRRVVWPTRKETIQTTLVVFAFVLAMAIFLWVVDKTLEYTLYDLILGWRK